MESNLTTKTQICPAYRAGRLAADREKLRFSIFFRRKKNPSISCLSGKIKFAGGEVTIFF